MHDRLIDHSKLTLSVSAHVIGCVLDLRQAGDLSRVDATSRPQIDGIGSMCVHIVCI